MSINIHINRWCTLMVVVTCLSLFMILSFQPPVRTRSPKTKRSPSKAVPKLPEAVLKRTDEMLTSMQDEDPNLVLKA